MAISYHHQLASLSQFVPFRILFRWKGSVWKHIYKELLIWIIIFLAISFFYRSKYFLNAQQKTIFGNLARYFDTRLEYIPITFILGFFVDTILSRWSNIFINMGYIESQEIDNFRYNLQLLCNYDWVPIPLVYSQVVFLAVYVHFIACLISRQFIVSNNTSISDLVKLNRLIKITICPVLIIRLDLIVPIMTIIQFVFFIGWLKVAQALLNPFGDDDDDFECNYLIDKNLATSFCIVDNYDRAPEVRPDLFWRSHKALSASTNTPLIGSVANLKLELTAEQAEMIKHRSQSLQNNDAKPSTISKQRSKD
ncbi:unnamed protein product [Onchocerca flexuosa]|uniref:Bestrophin homolog n=1 Tax=Onchocerca flexuosa TaxID=387005 RepID=A0A183HZE6_9BILA|nr:unnamed protein product [Onchocerca flexuosa]